MVARAECKRASALLVTPDRTFFGLGVPFCTDVSQLLAGKIEPFESPQDAVCREIHEETGGFVTAETVKHALLRDDAGNVVTVIVEPWDKPSLLYFVVMDLQAMVKIKRALGAWNTTRRGGDHRAYCSLSTSPSLTRRPPPGGTATLNALCSPVSRVIR